MHLDERIQNSREVIGKQLAVGQKKVSSAFNNLWADIEVMREAQRKRNEEHKAAAAAAAAADGSGPSLAGDKLGHLARCASNSKSLYQA